AGASAGDAGGFGGRQAADIGLGVLLVELPLVDVGRHHLEADASRAQQFGPPGRRRRQNERSRHSAITAAPRCFGRRMMNTSGIISRKTMPRSRKSITNDTIDACR